MSRYVTITRQEFIDFLKTIRKPFSLKQGTKGVYVVELSDNVGLAINSTIGDVVRGKAQASIQLSFVSLHQEKYHRVIYGYKKIMQRVVKKKHLQRSMNWRKTLKDAVDKCIAFYNSNNAFLEKIAVPESETDNTELFNRIESIPNWERNNFLQSLYDQLRRGRTLSDKQLKGLEKFEQRGVPVPPVREPDLPTPIPQLKSDLELMRDLYVELRDRKSASDEDLEELAEIGKSLKRKKSLDRSELEILNEICADYGVFSPTFSFTNRRMASKWSRVQVGNKASEIYYRGIPTGSILKVSRGYEAFINDMGRQKSLGVFKSEDQAFAKIQKEKK